MRWLLAPALAPAALEIPSTGRLPVPLPVAPERWHWLGLARERHVRRALGWPCVVRLVLAVADTVRTLEFQLVRLDLSAAVIQPVIAW